MPHIHQITKISSKEDNEKGNFFQKLKKKSPRSSNAHHVPPKSPARSAAQAASLLPRTATVSPSASLSAHPSTPGSSNVLSRHDPTGFAVPLYRPAISTVSAAPRYVSGSTPRSLYRPATPPSCLRPPADSATCGLCNPFKHTTFKN